MDLDSYLRLNNLSSARFARLIGAPSKQTVHNYRHGLRFPTPENLRRIREATNFQVTADDFVDQHAGQSLQPPTAPSLTDSADSRESPVPTSSSRRRRAA
jgi:hypothetical protein